jgi:hypothetical protein
MKPKSKEYREANTVASINFIRCQFEESIFTVREYKKRSKILKIPYSEKILRGLIQEDKIKKVGRDLYQFTTGKTPIIHTIIEKLLKAIENQKATQNATYKNKSSKKKVAKKKVISSKALDKAITIVKEAGLRVYKEI